MGLSIKSSRLRCCAVKKAGLADKKRVTRCSIFEHERHSQLSLFDLYWSHWLRKRRKSVNDAPSHHDKEKNKCERS